MRESLRERRILSNIAPNLVYPYPIVLPEPNLLARAGLYFYDILSFDRKWTWDRSKRLPAHRTLSRERRAPRSRAARAARSSTTTASGLCPERLTLYFLKSAAAHGARIANYARTENLVIEGNRVTGASVRDRITGRSVTVAAAVTVNAPVPGPTRC